MSARHARSGRRGTGLWAALVAVLAFGGGLLPGSSMAAGAAKAHLASSAVAELVAHDADALVSRLKHDWQRGSTAWSIARAPYGCCEVYDLARPGHYAHGVYILQSRFYGSRVASFRLIEMATHKGDRPGDAGLSLYRYTLQAERKGNWLVELEYRHHAVIDYTTERVLPREQDGELTASELQTLYEQMLAVFSKAEKHAPVSEEVFLHPGLTALPASLSHSAPPPLECHFGTYKYNTVLCGYSKQQGGEACARFAHETPAPPTGGYLGSTSAYRLQFQAEGLTGCDPAGVRTVTYFQELRDGASGPFVRSGKLTTRATNQRFKINDVQTIPYDCAADGVGSAVRTVVRLAWHPFKGWGGGNTRPDELTSKPEAICSATAASFDHGIRTTTPTRSEPSYFASTQPPYCDYPNNYYPGLCNVPKQQATDACAEQVAENNGPQVTQLQARYDEAAQRYRVSFNEPPTGGCGTYAGRRLVSTYQELREGSSGTFHVIGLTTTVAANGRYIVHRSSHEIFPCSASTAGSALRQVVAVRWIPNPGWGTTPTHYAFLNTPIVWARHSAAQVVCAG